MPTAKFQLVEVPKQRIRVRSCCGPFYLEPASLTANLDSANGPLSMMADTLLLEMAPMAV